jgi:hypothetical protein
MHSPSMDNRSIRICGLINARLRRPSDGQAHAARRNVSPPVAALCRRLAHTSSFVALHGPKMYPARSVRWRLLKNCCRLSRCKRKPRLASYDIREVGQKSETQESLAPFWRRTSRIGTSRKDKTIDETLAKTVAHKGMRTYPLFLQGLACFIKIAGRSPPVRFYPGSFRWKS